MKKLTCFLFTAILLLGLTACNGTADNETAGPATQGSSHSPSTEVVTPPTTQASFQEITLVDNENVTMKITAILEDDIWGYTLKAYLENKTDKELMFTVDSVSVNGFMCDPLWATTVAPGKKANEGISFSDSALEENGITRIEEITFTLRIYDSNDWLSDDLFKQTFTIHP